MTLPAPSLDDRTFQQLVDDAKRYIQAHCPSWSDHNVSDPGVTLVEAVAQMVDALVYRLNQVPDRLYLKFLELVGVDLLPPTPAAGPVTFWLSAPQRAPVDVPAATVVATERPEDGDADLYRTQRRLRIVPCSWSAAAVQRQRRGAEDMTSEVRVGDEVRVFGTKPRPGDALLVGLSAAVPSCAVRLHVDCGVAGIGVLPARPPLVWEAWTSGGWVPCEWADDTAGLNKSGRIVLHVPEGHVRSTVAGRAAGWLRARVVEPGPGERGYEASPYVRGLAAETIGGTVEAVNAEIVTNELLGLSEGVPGQRFPLQRGPVVRGEAPVRVEVGAGWEPWIEVDDFDRSEPDDRHFAVDRASGEVVFGPAVRERGGSLRQFGAVPPHGAPIRAAAYQVGGGHAGNAGRGRVRVLRTTVPFVAAVENRAPMLGGVDQETIDEVRHRGPAILSARDRAVTGPDYEELARSSAPNILRARCLTARDWADPVRVLLVPDVPVEPDGEVPFEDLVPDPDVLAAVAATLEEHRCLGARVVVEPPRYQGVTISAEVVAEPGADPVRVRDDALARLNRYFNPLVGGRDGDGWPFGQAIHVGDAYASLQGVPGVAYVEEVRLYAADPRARTRGAETARITLDADTLAYSFEPHVTVRGAP
jgi:predicted phage baseplate assembly protein